MGAKYRISNSVGDRDKGCSIAEPVVLETLGEGIELEPPALLDCPTAARLAVFVGSTMQPSAKALFGSAIKRITQDSAYVCRPRNGTVKLSEHAFGRAVDIGSIALQNGMVVPVMAMGKDREDEATYLANVRAAACGPFSTVLGPGSDPDHALHFHFDLAPRKGKPYCR